ncbi:MAG TPA: DUF1330 domain-containing protein [Roseovarius sp.]|nr:DUF1330 domain-containing protein [Roseovarius sp.]
MPKGYWVGHMDIDDPQQYDSYKAANAAPFAEYGARFLARGGAHECVEGKTRPRTVIIEFPSYQAALDCYQSDAYQKAKTLRDPVARGDLVIVEGHEG